MTRIFSDETLEQAARVLGAARRSGMRIVTAETCTGGLISASLTAVPGASQTYERGFVLYHSSAKATGLDVPKEISAQHGAVSGAVTGRLAEGALRASTAGVAVALTGYAGPGGGSETDPVGTIYTAVAASGIDTLVERHVFSGDRDAVRSAGVLAALVLLERGLSLLPPVQNGSGSEAARGNE